MNMQETSEIRELTAAELDAVDGGLSWSEFWDTVSVVTCAVAGAIFIGWAISR